MARRFGLQLKDGARRYSFPIAPREDDSGRDIKINTRPYQPGDPTRMIRKALHPWDGGIGINRLGPGAKFTCAKSDADTSFDVLVPPPQVNALDLEDTVIAAADAIITIPYNGKLYALGDRYAWQIDPGSSWATTNSNDFGAGKAPTSAAVFNGELIVAMGETEKIWKFDGSTWTQASDNTFATAIGVVKDRLVRAEKGSTFTNPILLSTCTTTPLTLANWKPSTDGNKDQVGDDTYGVHTIIEYGGVACAIKGDGAYMPDAKGRFYNQAPQMATRSHVDNGKGAFVGWGYLWVPTIGNLLRITWGESKPKGPEFSGRPDFRFWVRGGVEFGDAIFLLCTDESATSKTAIFKMTKDIKGLAPPGQEYLFHEWSRLGTTDKGFSIALTTSQDTPALVATRDDRNAFYINLGSGSGRYIDDTGFTFGTSLELETGPVQLGDDITVVTNFVGVEVMCDYSKAAAAEKLVIAFQPDNDPDSNGWQDLTDSQEGAGTTEINDTEGYSTHTRYAPQETRAQFVNIRFTGTFTANGAGTDRAEIREAYALAYVRPRVTDEIQVVVVADAKTNLPSGAKGSLNSPFEILNKFRQWLDDGSVLELDLDGYEEDRTVRAMVTSVESIERDTILGPGMQARPSTSIRLTLIRVDYANQYAGQIGGRYFR
jgi:hypothetical protein